MSSGHTSATGANAYFGQQIGSRTRSGFGRMSTAGLHPAGAGRPALEKIKWALSQHKTASKIFYKDWGKGQPIVFSHGWPLSADDWDGQMMFFLNKGFRVIAHDRRGHGRSGSRSPTATIWATTPTTLRRWSRTSRPDEQCHSRRPLHRRRRSCSLSRPARPRQCCKDHGDPVRGPAPDE